MAEKTPDRIKKVPVDIHAGVTDDIANDVAGLLTNSIQISFLARKGLPKSVSLVYVMNDTRLNPLRSKKGFIKPGS